MELKSDDFTAYQNHKVIWKINSVNVATIEGIDRKKPKPNECISPEIFEIPPQATKADKTEWFGKVIYVPKEEYEYYIRWTKKNDPQKKIYTYDPKIPVKPSDSLNGLLISMMGILSIFLGFGFGFAFKSRISKTIK